MITAKSFTDSRTVFLVDDDCSSLDLYSRRLEHAGFKTASAFNPAQVYEVLPDLSADLIILNSMLPKRGGSELLQAIRSTSRHKTTPVLILTNAYLPELAQRVMKAGGSKALPRSECTPSELISVSRELIGITESDGADQTADTESLKKALMDEGKAEVAVIRQHFRKYAEDASSPESRVSLETMYQRVRALTTRAGLSGCQKIAQLTGAVEAMLFDQLSRPSGGMSQSSMHTFARSMDCLERLFTDWDTGATDSTYQPRVLLVDDDQVCNMATRSPSSEFVARPSRPQTEPPASSC